MFILKTQRMPLGTSPLYLDYNATTPCHPEVVNAMLPWFADQPGNPSAVVHSYGRQAREVVDDSLQQIAFHLGVFPEELVVTSGATESCNLAVKGLYEAYKSKGRHVVAVSTEHKAILEPLYYLETKGAIDLEIIEVDSSGRVDTEVFRAALREDTLFAAVMAANNETGVLAPLEELGQICSEKGTLLMCDATQALFKIPFSPKELKIGVMAFSAHKFFGPKGIGGLYISSQHPRIKLKPQIHGGGQQGGMRSGTLNVPAIVGMGTACRIAGEWGSLWPKVELLRDRFEETLKNKIAQVWFNGFSAPRLPNTSNFGIRGVASEELLAMLGPKIALSTGSSCSSGNAEPSHVLLAHGLSEYKAKSCLRLSLSPYSQAEDVEYLMENLMPAIEKLREKSPLWQMIDSGNDPGEEW
jgi:cysteine desulfurase